MPKLIRLYIVNVAIGFALAVAFVALLVLLDIAHLRHLVLETTGGWLAAIMMVMFNGVVFAGVQFAIAVMRMAEDNNGPKGGLREKGKAPSRLVPIAIEAWAHSKTHR
ncbi:MAG: hypothetical protein Q7T25_15545 [Sideroxyarcus sp.]|nr:hypothetical protein [Sideroxyarcus sp.]